MDQNRTGEVTHRTLGTWHVAALLVSSSYGIAFLFGSGEQALRVGMAGSLYAVTTAVGMLVLALFASRIWQTGLPIWDQLGVQYGTAMRRSIALLSVVWMAGVLAAQIDGASAVLELAGIGNFTSTLVAGILVMTLGAARLPMAAGIFATCLLASNAVLAWDLVSSGHVWLYTHSLILFVHDTRRLQPGEMWTTVIAVGFLVVTGADYQQFVIASRTRGAAVSGCALSSLLLLLTGVLPACAVLATQSTGQLPKIADAKQAIPLVLVHGTGMLGSSASSIALAVLAAAALSSGAAIVRAMTTALGAAIQRAERTAPITKGGLVVALGVALANAHQGIVHTIIEVNVVYVAAVGGVFVSHAARLKIMPATAISMTLAGTFSASAISLLQAFGCLSASTAMPLLWGLPSSVAAAAGARLVRRFLSHGRGETTGPTKA